VDHRCIRRRDLGPPRTGGGPTRSLGLQGITWATVADGAAVTVESQPLLSRAEPVVRRLLLVPEEGVPRRRGYAADARAHRLFNISIVLSGLRCLLGYVVIPIVTPAIGAAARVAPVIGIPVATLALVFDVMAVRRFWIANHRWRWGISVLYVAVMSMVLALLIGDLVHLS